MSKSRIIQIVSILFLGSLLVYLLFFSDATLMELGRLLLKGASVGLIFGGLIASFYSLSNPPEWIFDYRYILEGIGWGLMIAAINLSIDISEESLSFGKTIFMILFCGGMGILWIYFSRYKKLQRQMAEYLPDHSDAVDLYDFANFSDEEHDGKNGLVLLSEDHLEIISADTHEKLADLQLGEINPKVNRWSWFNIPAGIQLTDHKEVKMKFPLYWFSKIRMQKSRG